MMLFRSKVGWRLTKKKLYPFVMHQEIPASAIFKVVEILIIASLLVLLPGGRLSNRHDETAAASAETTLSASASAQMDFKNEPNTNE